MFATQGTALILEVIIGIFTVLGGFVAGIRWLTKHYFEEIKGELKTNGGSSLKDQVNRLEEKVNVIYDIVIKNK